MPSTKKANVLRFQSYDRTQSFVMDLVGQSAPHTPKIALQLSQEDGPDWTDVMLDGCIVAHVQTSALTRGRPAH